MSDTKPMTCEEALRLLAEHLDGELARGDQSAIEEHLRLCRSCFSRAEFERRLKSQLGALRDRPVAPTFEVRIRTLIGRFTAMPDAPPASD